MAFDALSTESLFFWQNPQRICRVREEPTKYIMDDNLGTIAPSNFTINGVEYSPDDAQSLIELGNKTREFESKWNTPVDSLMPAYTKSREELKTAQTERDEAKRQIQEFQAKQDAGTDTQVDRNKARQAAKELGFVLDDDIKDKFVSRDELDKYYDEREQRKEAVKQVLDTANKLETEIDGSDGRPKFVKKTVLAYAQAYKFDDLTKAYEDMHKESLDAWKAEQIDSKKGKSLKTLTPSGAKKEPGEVKPNDDNVNELLKETLWGKS